MPSSALDIPVWERPAPTSEQLEYAELACIDLSKWPARKEELVSDLRHAVTEVGFWCVPSPAFHRRELIPTSDRFVENTGISDEEVIRQHSIGNAFLDTSLDEKRKYPCNFSRGNFFGFREGFRIMGDSGVKDNSEA